MQKFFISTDQTADFPMALCQKNFDIMPMTYTLDGVLYDGKNLAYLSSKDFYDALAEGKTATTSMVPVIEAQAFFEDILAKGFDILHISFSSKLSGCYQGYLTAKDNILKNNPNAKIEIVDSLCASIGEGLLCYYALEKRESGASFEDTISYVNELRHHIGHIFTVDDMLHLYKGGRVSKRRALLGSVIKVKPLLTVDHAGYLVPTINVLGKKVALKTFLSTMRRTMYNAKQDTVFIAHADCINDAIFLSDIIKSAYPNITPIIVEMGAVVGSHCGKGMIGLSYLATTKHTSHNP